jgi:alpha-L-rhamnosidase
MEEKMKTYIITIITLISILFCICTKKNITGVVPIELRCEYQVNPLGIDATNPRLSWILKSDIRNQKQTAYQVLVANTEENLKKDNSDLWENR